MPRLPLTHPSRLAALAGLLLVPLVGPADEPTEAQLRATVARLEKEAAAEPLAAAHEALGDLLARREDEVEAAEAFAAAVRVRQQEAARDPKQPAPRTRLAAARTKLSRTLINLQQWAEADRACREALEAAAQACRAFPADPAHRADLARAQAHRAGLLWNQFRRADAAAAKREEVRTWADLAAADPAHRARLAQAQGQLGFWLVSVGDHPAALEVLAEAVRTGEAAVARDPKDRPARVAAEQALEAHGFALREAGQWVAAERALRRVEAARRANAAGRDPADARRALAGVLRGLAMVHQLTGKTWELAAAYREALDIEGALAAGPRPTAKEAEQALLTEISHGALGQVARMGPPADRVRRTSRELLDARQARADRHPDVPGYRFALAAAEIGHGTTALAEGGAAEAADRADRMMAITRKLAADHPDVPFYRLQVALGTVSQASAAFARSDPDGGRALAADAFAQLEKLASELPGDAYFLYQACEAQWTLCGDRYPELALAYHRQGLEGKARLIRQFPANTQYRIHHAVGSKRVGQELGGLGDAKGAEGHMREAERVWAELASAHPTVPDFRCGAAEARGLLAAFLRDTGRRADAERLLDQVLADLAGLCGEYPEETRFALNRARALGARARLADDPARTVEFHTRAAAGYEAVLEKDPRNQFARAELVDVLKDRGLAYNRLGRYADYDRDWDRAQAVRAEGARLAEAGKP